MRAAVHRKGVIEVQDVDMPVPKDDEVLVRVHAATVAAADYRIGRMLRSPIGRLVTAIKKKPFILGMEVSGTVHALGQNVNRFRVGEEVFGLRGTGLATQAEFVCVPEKTLEPTGVCSTANVAMVRSLGADEVVDYTREDFSKAGRAYDVIIDTVGYAGFSRCLRSLKRGAPFIRVAPSGGLELPSFILSMFTDTFRALWISMSGAAKMMGGIPKIQPGDYAFLRKLVEAGTLKPVIDRRYRLDEIAEAYRYADTGHKKGHVVIQFVTLPAGPSPRPE